MRPIAVPFALSAVLAALPVAADDVTDALDSARGAYEEGDIAYAIEELTYARQLMLEQKAASFSALLPKPLDGWTREISTEGNAAMAMMGGGTTAEASYTKGGESFTITLIADSPMIAMMAGMIANPAMAGGKMVRVGRQKFVDSDGELSTVVDNRVLVQASGGARDAMIAHLEAIDYAALTAGL